MFRPHTLAASICAAFAMSGCALLPTQRADASLQVRPAYAIQHGGVKPEQFYGIGRQLQNQGRYDEASVAFRAALTHQPAHADAHNALGVVQAAQGRYREAIEAFKAAIALAPAAGYLHNNLGYVLLLSGDADAAVGVLSEALRLEPDNDKALHNLRVAMLRALASKPSQTAAAPAAPTMRSEAPTSPMPESSTTPAIVDLKDGTDTLVVAPNLTLNAVAPHVYELQPVGSPAPAAVAAEAPRADVAAAQLKPYKLEVSNGNGVSNMARRVADFLEQLGIATGRLTNAASFRESTTIIEYRQGYRAEAVALGAALPKAVPAVQSDTLRADIDLRVVLGQDVRSDVALFEPQRTQGQLMADAQPRAAR